MARRQATPRVSEWTPMTEYVPRKDPTGKPWVVSQHRDGHLRCNCPGFIFTPVCGVETGPQRYCSRKLTAGAGVDLGRGADRAEQARGSRLHCDMHGAIQPGGSVQRACRHILMYLADPVTRATTAAAIPPETLAQVLAQAWRVVFTTPLCQRNQVHDLPHRYPDLWAQFIERVDRVRPVSGGGPSVTTTQLVLPASNLGVRRIAID